MMKRWKRMVAVLLCLCLLPVNLVSADAAGYVYNWGSRGDTATQLSSYAQAFYTGANAYDALSALPGGTGTSDAPSSELYKALKSLMAGAQTYETSYNATRDLFKYTDCENGGGAISSFYSGTAIGPEWDSTIWNREHTWPNSKGDASGNGENDIMMLRPTAKSENSSRGNKAYGKSDGYYNPNSVSGGSLDLRGDVSRIMLFVYVRWGNTGSMWGSSGVIESLDVLTEWMAADPVDTWELGRNDSVQSITGTRNVFVDYPEFAFLLFGEDIPTTMITPSGEAANAVNCEHNYVAGETIAATCTTDGYTIYTCTLCSKRCQGDKVAAGHTYVGGTCTACGTIEYGVVEKPVAGTAYKFGMIQKNVSDTAVYYLNGDMAKTYYMATGKDKTAAIDVFLEETEGGYYCYTLSGNTKQYINMVVSGTHVNGVYEATASTVYTFDEESKTIIASVDGENYWFGTRNDKTYTTVGPCATSYNGFYCQFYGNLNQPEPGAPECPHTNTKVEGKVDATCTTDGHTGKTVCADCSEIISEGEAITATGHSWTDATCTAPKTCSVCGETEGEELGHDMGEWVVVTEPSASADGEERRACSRCDHVESRPIQYQGNFLKLEGDDLLNQSVVYINGLPYPAKGEGENRYVEISAEEDCYMVTYTYHVGDASDIHTQYPTGMKVYKVSGGKITYIPELDNLLQYSGSSIRITGKKGIRMITSLTKDNKAALTGKGLAGYKLLEYGTVLCFDHEVAGDGDLVLGKPYSRSNYAYKRGVKDPVFATTGNLTQYTNVLVGFTLDQCRDDLSMRPYIILEDANGEQVTLYGGTVHRSIGYIAYQNRNVFKAGSGAYDYVWEVIHHVYGDQYDADYKG